MVHLEEDMTEFGMKLKDGERLRKWPADGLDGFRTGRRAFMRKWHNAESCRAAERHAKNAASPPTVDTNMRRGGVGGGREGGGEGGGGG